MVGSVVRENECKGAKAGVESILTFSLPMDDRAGKLWESD